MHLVGPLLLLLLVPVLLHGQSDDLRYMAGTLIIKYEDQRFMQELRFKTGEDPLNRVRSFLSTVGAGQPEPLFPGIPGSGSAELLQRFSHRNIDRDQVSKALEELRRIHKLKYLADVDPAWLAAKVSKLPGVAYAEPRYLRFTQYIPSDPETNPYEEFHRFREAWDLTRGSTEVIIAIVDSGVDYNHEDLDEKLWRNEDEIPGNGVDDDNNGKIDDVIGWDFWASGYIPDTFTQDNDPMIDVNPHGTHVTGIAAAETDNGIGIAGTGFNARYMAVKAGGVPDNPDTDDFNESQAIGFGPEGILYAARNGADVINCSFGGGGFSQAENDVIEFAASVGAVVVGAAGNNGSPEVVYPAAYPDALAVGAVDPGTGTRSGYSNYGYELDVMATGSDILSTIDNNRYAFSTGTSMATPVVSGLAALLRAQNPGWSAKRIATHIRATAVPIADNNLLGRGRVDAFEAVSSSMSGVNVEKVAFVNRDGNKLGFMEQGNIRVTLVNYGAPTSGLELKAEPVVDKGVELSAPEQSVGRIATGDTVLVEVPLRITGEFDLNRDPTFRLVFHDAASSYTDFDVVQYTDLLFDVMAENRVKMSISADGTIGFTDPLSQEGGVGFIPRTKVNGSYEEGQNLLFEGGFMLEFSGKLLDAVRTTDGGVSRDFNPETTVRLQAPGTTADLEAQTRFSSDSVSFQAAEITLNSFAFTDPDLSNVVYLLYEITNPSSYFELEDLHAGLFNDWDIGTSAGNNGTAYNAQDSILYVFDEDPKSDQPLVAVAALGPQSSALAIDNAAGGRGPEFGIYDGFTDEEKRRSLKAGTVNTEESGTDVSAVVASGPYTVGARASVRVGFVYAFGETLEELRAQVQQARSRKPFTVSPRGFVASGTEEPSATEFFQNYPNPFNGTTRLRLDLAKQQRVSISIYNILGQKVQQIVDEELKPRIHIFTFDAGNLGSGIYFARLITESRSETIKLVLVK
ncbi:MAG: S8 family serine peptidase [Balneolaceae bacterium]|nr:S8 family serine peptidase [Balneolaceae bacterium]